MDPHVTSEELALLRSGRLSPEASLRVLRHRAACAECRGAKAAAADLKVLRGLLEFDTCPSETPEGEQLLVGLALGRFSPEKSEALQAHTSGCPKCQAILSELREDRAELRAPATVVEMPRRWPRVWRIAAAAAVIAAVGGMVWVALHRQATVETAVERIRDGGAVLEHKPDGQWTGVPAGDSSDAKLIASVLRSGRLPAPLAAMEAPPPAMLRGTAASAPFSLTAPVYARVEADTPEFSWTGWKGAASYQVAVFTIDNHVLELSRELPGSTNSWKPSKPLPRGVRLYWQVTATRRGGDPVLVPAPPAPQVFFEVIGSEAAGRIARAKAAQPPSHLLLAALYAEQGLSREAQEQVDALARENPGSRFVRQIYNILP